jgi:uncharacterized membrane protein YhaH (DUF805 family)
MDFKALYTTTDGRISRQTWWIGAVILGVTNIVITLLILPIFGLGMPDMAKLAAGGADAAAISAALSGSMQGAAWGSLVVFVLMAYPAYCLSVKRRHDKNNAGQDVLIYFGLTLVLLLVQALGFGYTMGEIGGISVPQPSAVYMVLGLIAGIFGIYMLVVLGFLKGTAGPNDFGPDPLGG